MSKLVHITHSNKQHQTIFITLLTFLEMHEKIENKTRTYI